MRVPSLAPAGIFTAYCFVRRSTARAAAAPTRVLDDRPLSAATAARLQIRRSPGSRPSPRALHSGQTLGGDPSAVAPPQSRRAAPTSTGMRVSIRAAGLRTTAGPRSRDRRRDRRAAAGRGSPPPKMSANPPNRSPRSPMLIPPSPKLKLRPSAAAVGRAEGVGLLALVRVGEDVVRACTSLKRSSASLSPRFLSGWHSRTSLRYAFLISSASPSSDTQGVVQALGSSHSSPSGRRPPPVPGAAARSPTCSPLQDLDHWPLLGLGRLRE